MNHHELADVLKILVIMGAILGLFLAHDRRHSERAQRTLNGFFVVLAMFATLAYFNLGSFHGGHGYIHTWEMYHYHLSSKYFDELGYDGLYEATLVADAEGGQPYLAPVQKVRDLRTYEVISRGEVLAHSSARERFTPERWQEFRRDVDYFKHRYPPAVWQRVLLDHGYNAPPSRTVLTGWVARRLGPANDRSIYFAGLLDLLLLLSLLIVIYRVYGLRNAALVTILFGVNMLSAFYWVGGAFLRFDWLVLSGLGLCALAAGRHGLAGGLIGGAAMIRIFPVFFALGVVLRGLILFSRSRSWDPRYTRFSIGVTSAGAGLLLLSLLATGGIDAWLAFYTKIRSHLGPLYFNSVGLRCLLGENQLLLLGGRLLAFGVYLLSLRKLADDSQAAILGGVLIFVFGSISGYYYAFLILFLIWQRRAQLHYLGVLSYSLLLLSQGVAISLQSVSASGQSYSSSQLPYFYASLVLVGSFVALFAWIQRAPPVARESG